MKMKYLKRALGAVLMTAALAQPSEAQHAVPRDSTQARQPANGANPPARNRIPPAFPTTSADPFMFRHYLPQTARPNGVGPGEQGYVGNNPTRWRGPTVSAQRQGWIQPQGRAVPRARQPLGVARPIVRGRTSIDVNVGFPVWDQYYSSPVFGSFVYYNGFMRGFWDPFASVYCPWQPMYYGRFARAYPQYNPGDFSVEEFPREEPAIEPARVEEKYKSLIENQQRQLDDYKGQIENLQKQIDELKAMPKPSSSGTRQIIPVELFSDRICTPREGAVAAAKYASDVIKGYKLPAPVNADIRDTQLRLYDSSEKPIGTVDLAGIAGNVTQDGIPPSSLFPKVDSILDNLLSKYGFSSAGFSASPRYMVQNRRCGS